MSWDIVVFKLNRKVATIEEIDETILLPIGTWKSFGELINAEFQQVSKEDEWCIIEGEKFSLETSLGEPENFFSNTIFHLYGEAAISPLIYLCKKYQWQAYDTVMGGMIDLDDPERNGFENFNAYLKQILRR